MAFEPNGYTRGYRNCPPGYTLYSTEYMGETLYKCEPNVLEWKPADLVLDAILNPRPANCTTNADGTRTDCYTNGQPPAYKPPTLCTNCKKRLIVLLLIAIILIVR